MIGRADALHAVDRTRFVARARRAAEWRALGARALSEGVDAELVEQAVALVVDEAIGAVLARHARGELMAAAAAGEKADPSAVLARWGLVEGGTGDAEAR